MCPLFVLLGILAAGGATNAAAASGPAEVAIRCLRGHARLAEDEAVHWLTQRSEPRRVANVALLSCGPTAELELVWGGRASVRSAGASAFAWAPPAADERPRLLALKVSSLDLEVRRGPWVLELPEGWELSLSRAVLNVRREAGGELRIAHRGGEPIEIASAIGGDERTAPRRLLSGEHVRLAPVAQGAQGALR